jgi:uncharacterized protein (DUF362 family)
MTSVARAKRAGVLAFRTMEEPVVVVARPGIRYGPLAPFDPPNPVYDMVEAALRGLGLDAARAGTAEWNPLGDVIAPGDRVVVKPSFVASQSCAEPRRGEQRAGSSTHGALLRPILDYALRAVGPRGRVTLADAPDAGCDLENVAAALGVRALVDWYAARGRPIDFLDLRHFRVVPRLLLDDVRGLGRSFDLGLLVRERLPGDPLGYSVVDVGERSYFEAVADRAPRFCFDRSHRATPRSHHARGRHEYSIPRTLLDADVVISIPKLATHEQSGATLALQSALGLTNEKSWLPRYTAGARSAGGDEYPFAPPWPVRLENRLRRVPLPLDNAFIARAPRQTDGRADDGLLQGYILEGSWEGNDTLWRTTLDLNLVLFYADRSGRLRDRPQRRYLALVDGIIAGEDDRPSAATPRAAGLLIAGRDPALVDVVAARAMGYDEANLPAIARALAAGGRPLLSSSDAAALRVVHDGPAPVGTFVPPRGWPSLSRPGHRVT